VHVRTLVVAALIALASVLSGCTIYTAGAQPGYRTHQGYGYRAAGCDCRCPEPVTARAPEPAEDEEYLDEEQPIDPYQRSYRAPRQRSRFGERPEDWLE
jgi:hypothetical protein